MEDAELIDHVRGDADEDDREEELDHTDEPCYGLCNSASHLVVSVVCCTGGLFGVVGGYVNDER